MTTCRRRAAEHPSVHRLCATTKSIIAQVFGPTIPSTVRPKNRWKFRVDVSVLFPKIPSTTRCCPAYRLSSVCQVETAGPREPTLRTGRATGGGTGPGAGGGVGGRPEVAFWLISPILAI